MIFKIGIPSSSQPSLCIKIQFIDYKTKRSCIPSFPVKIAEFAILGLNLSGIDFGMMCQYVLPPLLVEFLEMYLYSFVVL